MFKVLLVEDSQDYYTLVKRSMSGSVHLEWATSLAKAFKAIKKNSFDLILLDVMLPDGDGFQLCSGLQTQDSPQKPSIIFLSSKNTISDKVLGFSVGGDDFITKPFSQHELRARVDARLRRRQREDAESHSVRFGDIEINMGTQRVQL
jgi:DNA-binding response OmpR family regulator